MPRPEGERPEGRRAPRIVCAGTAALDQIFRVGAVPSRDRKADAFQFVSVLGGCAANAAVAIARLGGQARFVGALGGPAGTDTVGDRILAGLDREGVATAGVRVAGASSPVSAVLVDTNGGRTVTCHRDPRLGGACASDPDGLVADVDAVLADDHFPSFVQPICAAARRRGLPVVIDAESPAGGATRLFGDATHVVFSRPGLCAAAGCDDVGTVLGTVAVSPDVFVAVTDGAGPVRWRMGSHDGSCPVFGIEPVDTLAAGDVFHGAFVLALVEGLAPVDALRFAAAAAAIKCTRFGGGGAAPTRAELERFIGENA